MDNIKVALVGAGQLGSRHLQGLASCLSAMDIFVVEPSAVACEVAEQRFNEIRVIGGKKTLEFIGSVEGLPECLDVVIVATNSDVRFGVTHKLLTDHKVRFLILEKVLFQSVSEYERTSELLKEARTKCFVNHTRRCFPFYQQLKKELSAASEISFSVSGGAWGLGCNGLHFIDIFSFLCGGGDVSVSPENLNNVVYETKRKGFVEFNGCLNGKIGKNNFSLVCLESQSPHVVNITSDVFNAYIEEGTGFARFSRKEDGWKKSGTETKIVCYQSELSGVVVDELMKNGTCMLPEYDESAKLHVPFIRALMKKMTDIDGFEHNICPIT
ncbi:Gfo/Idh/MocA family oxidoreductase [Sphaerochaeta sp.]|uniref:Gfo/Idh/MocA family oxidoreductase n=1 Tax=Sphaerochaeta sp. TaxID=1972642 RepID=UPI003D0F9769